MNILLCFGTRPEAIKMAPLYHALKKQEELEVKVCVTAQHREMLDQVLEFFEINVDYDLDLMTPNQSLNELTAKIINNVDDVLKKESPDWVLVHGDTTTSIAVALAAFHLKIKVGHVEAGLRTYNLQEPFPEEMNRQLVSKLAILHFTPTRSATENLIKEGITQDHIFQVGNSVVEALHFTLNKLNHGYTNTEIERVQKLINKRKKLILVTGHRRENFGEGIQQLAKALKQLSQRTDCYLIYPVHPNPNVKIPMEKELAHCNNMHLIEPLNYLAFVFLMNQAVCIITDSGGIQEEAPTLGVPVILTRNVTERMEGVVEGYSLVTRMEADNIIKAAERYLTAPNKLNATVNPYGDGKTAERIIKTLIGGV